jgi:hypothetical protein
MTFPVLKSKTLAIAAAAFALASAVIAVPAAQARPTYCTEWAWANCDPEFTRGTPEWQACFTQYYNECFYARMSNTGADALKGACLSSRKGSVKLAQPA